MKILSKPSSVISLGVLCEGGETLIFPVHNLKENLLVAGKRGQKRWKNRKLLCLDFTPEGVNIQSSPDLHGMIQNQQDLKGTTMVFR